MDDIAKWVTKSRSKAEEEKELAREEAAAAALKAEQVSDLSMPLYLLAELRQLHTDQVAPASVFVVTVSCHCFWFIVTQHCACSHLTSQSFPLATSARGQHAFCALLQTSILDLADTTVHLSSIFSSHFMLLQVVAAK